VDKKAIHESQLYNNTNIDELMPSQNSGAYLDVLSWVLKILKFWYLFVIAGILAFSLAYLKNKSWTPTYRTVSTLLVQEVRAATLRNDVGYGYQGLGMGGGLGRPYTNQMIMYQSYDFVNKVVDSLDINYDIYEKHRFKNEDKYKKAPIQIKSTYIAGRAYGMEFKITGIDDNSFSISYKGETLSYIDKILRRGYVPTPAFEVTANYDEPFQHSFFFLTVNKTDLYVNPSFELYVRFAPKSSWVSNFKGRLNTRLLSEGASIVEISMVGKVAQRDIDFLNLLNKEFAQQNLDYKNFSAEKTTDFLERQLLIFRDSIDSAESKLIDYQMATGLSSADVSTNKSQLVTELQKGRNGLKLRKNYMNLLENELNKQEEDFLTEPSVTGVSNNQLNSLVIQYNNLLISSRGLGTQSPVLASNRRQIADIKTQIQSNLKVMNQQYDIDYNDVETRLNAAEREVANLPKQERALLTHQRDVNINDSYYNFLLTRRLESQLQKASNSPDNIIIDTPRVVGWVNGREKQAIYILFLAIGLLIPLIFVICKEILFKFSIQTREELERISGLPVLGTIERSKRKEFLAVRKYPRSSFAECFRNLRARMEFITKKDRKVSVLVTSTEPKDGKTFIAVNLASIYRIAQRKVIILDFDLRRPMLTKSLDLENKPGISNYLISQVELKDVIYNHPELNIDVIPAGAIPPNPSELIRSDRTKELLDILYDMYDYVILDCGPIGLVSDALSLSRLVDVVVYVVRNEKTNRNFFKYTVRELLEDNINNIALVYNDVDIQSGYYGSRRYYGKNSYYLKHGSYYSNDDD